MEARRVWIPSPVEGWTQATVLSDDGDKLTVYNEVEQINEVVKSKDVIDNRPFELLPDMIGLPELHEATLLHNLRMRYQKDQIYTYIGPMVVSINPYQKLPIYGDELIPLYQSKPRDELPPHLYSIANKSFQALTQLGQSQSVVISGESGAGKTEATKYVLKYLTTVAKSSCAGNMDLASRILATNPVLEAFGNAKTIRNNNSSRFGKFIKIAFDHVTGSIIGARIDNYLLEQTRIIHQAPTERNYHVFYQLITGAAPEERKKYQLLDSLDDYYYLTNGALKVDGIDDIADWNTVKNAMYTLKIPQEDLDEYFRLLSGILHLGNVQFKAVERNGMVEAHIVDTDQLAIVTELLGLGKMSGVLRQCLTTRKVSAGVRSSTASVPYNLEQAVENRDALAKAIYSRMFDHLVLQLNNHLIVGETYPENSKFIGVLDIYGFEKFQENSLEQFCINYANEKLHNQFNEHMFHAEQQEYRNEGVEWNTIEFTDNKATIAIIEGGLLNMLDEECKIPKGSDKTFLDKMKIRYKLNAILQFPVRAPEEFIINHYAEPVNYDVNNFLNKNRDKFSNDVVSVMSRSSSPLLKELFKEGAALNNEDDEGESEGLKRSNTIGRNRGNQRELTRSATINRFLNTNVPASKRQDTTVTKKFSTSLSDLVATLAASNRHYVRCIKPNNKALPRQFVGEKILGQLRSNGVLETVKLRKAGYANRIPMEPFMNRYGILPKFKSTSAKHLRKFLTYTLSNPKEWAIGYTKVFLRNTGMEELERKRTEFLYRSLVTIQTQVRVYNAINKLIKLRIAWQKRVAAATTFQKHIRAWYARNLYFRLAEAERKRRTNAAIVIQRHIRLYEAWLAFMYIKDAEIRRQIEEERQRRRLEAIVVFQKYCRQSGAIDRFMVLQEERAAEERRQRMIQAAIVIQRYYQRYAAILEKERRHQLILEKQARRRAKEEEKRRRKAEKEERRRREEEERLRREAEEAERRRREEEERIRREIEEAERRRREEEERIRREAEEAERRRKEEEERIRREAEEAERRRKEEEERIRREAEEAERRRKEEEERIRREAEEAELRRIEEEERLKKEAEEAERKRKEAEEAKERLRRESMDKYRSGRGYGRSTSIKKLSIPYTKHPSDEEEDTDRSGPRTPNQNTYHRPKSRSRVGKSTSTLRHINRRSFISSADSIAAAIDTSSTKRSNESIGLSYDPAEDIEDTLFRICNREKLNVSTEALEEYADILRKNFIIKLGNIAELDSDSWVMLAQQKFPVRIRQLLINEVQQGATKNNDRSIVSSSATPIPATTVGLTTMISGIWDGLFGMSTGIVGEVIKTANPLDIIPTHDVVPTNQEERALDLLYQVSHMIHIRGDYYYSGSALPQDVMIEMAALHCQVVFGDYDDFVCSIDSIIRDPEQNFFPFADQQEPDQGLEIKAFERYKHLHGMSQEQAKLRFIRILQSLPKNDGVVRFYVSSVIRDGNHSTTAPSDSSDPLLEQEWTLGISQEKVYQMLTEEDTDEERIEAQWDFSKVTRLRYDPTTQIFTIDLMESSPLEFYIAPEEGTMISALIYHHIETYQSKLQESETQKRMNAMKSEVEIEVRIYGNDQTTIFTVKVCDLISDICNNIAKYYKFDNDGRYGLKPESRDNFLVPNKAFNLQDIDFFDVFVFMTRLFIPSTPISKQHDYIHFLFMESHNHVINGNWSISKDQVIKLAALELQYKHGDYNPKIHTHNFFNQKQMELLLPNEFQQPQSIPEIIKEYKRLTGVPPSDACYRYAEAIRKLQTYGDTFFPIMFGNHSDVLSINANFICHFESESHRLLSEWSLEDVRGCSVDTKGEGLTIDFIDGAFSCNSRDALYVERLILDYIDYGKNKAKFKTKKSDENCIVM